jgi:hypothetical protein
VCAYDNHRSIEFPRFYLDETKLKGVIGDGVIQERLNQRLLEIQQAKSNNSPHSSSSVGNGNGGGGGGVNRSVPPISASTSELLEEEWRLSISSHVMSSLHLQPSTDSTVSSPPTLIYSSLGPVPVGVSEG